MADTLIYLGNTRKMSLKYLPIVLVKMIFSGFVRAELIKLAGMAGVMHEADHAYSIWSTWLLHRLATDVPSIACVINCQSIFVYSLDLSIFLLESGLSYFLFLSVRFQLVYFVSAAGYHCFDYLHKRIHYCNACSSVLVHECDLLMGIANFPIG